MFTLYCMKDGVEQDEKYKSETVIDLIEMAAGFNNITRFRIEDANRTIYGVRFTRSGSDIYWRLQKGKRGRDSRFIDLWTTVK
jgi:hypothetical protein